MAEYTEEQLDEMTDEELESAAREATVNPQGEGEDDNEDPSDVEPENVDNDDTDPEPEDNPEEDPADEDDVESDDEVEDPEPETSEPSEGQPDGEPESGEDDKEDPEPETTTQEFEPLKVSGKSIPINSLEELYTLASGGAAVTQKFQEIAAHKKSISIMEQHGLTEKDLSMLIEARNGSKDAMASLIKQSGIDSLDVTDEVSEGYQAGQFVPSDQQVSLQEVQREISRDQEYSVTQNVVNNVMDSVSQDMLVQNPQMIRGIHEDIKSGAYELVSAHAEKLKLMDGGRRPDMEYYIQAARTGPGDQQQQQAPVLDKQPEQQAPAKKSVSKDKRRAAGSNKTKKSAPSIKDIEDMSDEELMSYREKIMDRF